MMHSRWLINRTNPEYIQYLSRAVSVSPAFAQILINRGIKTPDEASGFLNPSASGFSDPLDLPDMQAALKRIESALSRNERVLIHGDYDADGLTASAIMSLSLRALGIDAHCFIPNRLVHGYGFNPPGVDAAKQLGAKLIITVDCGISSFEAASYAREKGIDVIITDHHEPALKSAVGSQQSADEIKDFLLPDAVAVVNPKLITHNSQLKNLSGAGIAFKIAQAFAMCPDFRFSNEDALSLLDLAVLGTVADVVPLKDENRAIASEGMKLINSSHRAGIMALRASAGLGDRELKAGLLSFTMIPRINAAGRIGDANEVINLFMADSEENALLIADKLGRLNTERQQIEEAVYQEALSLLNEKGYDSVIVLCGKGWHIGVVGIVASRIAEEFFRPTFVFSLDNDTAKGSARSIPSFDLYEGLSLCKDLLLSFGGHKQAAGVRLHCSNLSRFESAINMAAKEMIKKEEFTPAIEIDAEVGLPDVSMNLIKEIGMLEPLGYGNPEPLLGARKLEVLNPRVVGNNHLKMRLRQRSMTIDAIGFDMGGLIEKLDLFPSIDAAFVPSINEWNGGRYLQISLKAFRPSGQ